MPDLRRLIRVLLRFLAAFIGLALLGYLVFRTGPAVIWKQVQQVGWGLLVIIILGGIAQFIKTCAWRQTFTCDISGLSWGRSYGVQLVSDAAGQLGLPGKLIGEGLRVSLLGSAVPLPNGISAAAIDGGLHILTAAVVTVLGIIATLFLEHLAGRWRVDALLITALLVLVVALAAAGVAKRFPLMGNAARVIGHLPILHHWVSARRRVTSAS